MTDIHKFLEEAMTLWPLLLCAVFVIVGLICLVLGLYLHQQGRLIGSIIAWCVAGAQPLVIVLTIILSLLIDSSTTKISTENGVVRISAEEEEELEDAVWEDKVEYLTEMLEEEPAYMEYKTDYGTTLLGMAITNRSYQVTKYLLEQGMKVEQVGRDENKDYRCTALELYLNSMGGKEKVDHRLIGLLLDHGAVVNAKRKPIIQKLFQRMIKDGSLDEEDLELLQKLVDKGANLEQKNKNGLKMEGYYQYLTKYRGIREQQPEAYQKGLEIIGGTQWGEEVMTETERKH